MIGLALGGCTRPSPNLPRVVNPNLRIALATLPAAPRQLDPTRFTVALTDDRKQPVSGATVTADLAMPDMDMGKNRITLTPQAPGTYVGTGRFTMPGDWRVIVTAIQRRDRAIQSFSATVR